MSELNFGRSMQRTVCAAIALVLSVASGHAPVGGAGQETSVVRDGRSITVLPDGRRLIIGGDATRHVVAIEDGAELFERAQCATCHTPVTGVAVIGSKTHDVKAYTDLLLHEMGAGIRTRERDSRTEFRTPPLWGVAATAPYLHDGSAPTLEAAILRHGGEATEAQRRYTTLAAADRQRLLHFVATR